MFPTHSIMFHHFLIFRDFPLYFIMIYSLSAQLIFVSYLFFPHFIVIHKFQHFHWFITFQDFHDFSAYSSFFTYFILFQSIISSFSSWFIISHHVLAVCVIIHHIHFHFVPAAFIILHHFHQSASSVIICHVFSIIFVVSDSFPFSRQLPSCFSNFIS